MMITQTMQYKGCMANILPIARVSIYRADGCLTAKSREVSKPRYSDLNFSSRCEIWQTLWQHCCQDACQISEWYNHYNTQSPNFEASQDLAVRCLTANKQRPWSEPICTRAECPYICHSELTSHSYEHNIEINGLLQDYTIIPNVLTIDRQQFCNKPSVQMQLKTYEKCYLTKKFWLWDFITSVSMAKYLTLLKNLEYSMLLVRWFIT